MITGSFQRKVYLDEVPLTEAIRRWSFFLTEKGMGLPAGSELVPVPGAARRVTAEPVFAAMSVPHYAASAMDGIAVRSADTYRAGERNPVRLKTGEQFILVDTGQPVPEGFDAVIKIEDVHQVEPGVVEIVAPAAPWQHVRPIGEDLVATELLLPAGHVLRPPDLGVLLAAGLTEVAVAPRPRVAVLPTGSELVAPGQVPRPGQIVEFNSVVLTALVEEWGGMALQKPVTPDEPDRLRESLRAAAEEADFVVINAGSSAGSRDYTAPLLAELGEVLLHGVAIKPGKPVILGAIGSTPVLGLPGYPVSTVLTAHLFLRPVLARFLGLSDPAGERMEAAFTRRVTSPMGQDEFVRVKLGKVGDRLVATPLSRGAGVLSSLVRADGWVRIPAGSEGLEAGEGVTVQLQRGREEIEDTVVAIGSHDVALDLLAAHLARRFPGRSLASAHVGSLGGLLALRRGEAHLAGVHLLDEDTGEYNIPFLARYLGGEAVVLINLALRKQGLMVPPGNPLGLRGWEDLAREGLRFVNRQRGAGTRLLLDFHLRRLGIAPEGIRGYNREEFTHLGTAAAVAAGAADTGIGILAAARALGLDFFPLADERYDLAVPARQLEDPKVKQLLVCLRDPAFQEAVKKLGGYDLSLCGEEVGRSA
ncbi:MAG: molybdopterin biosynthesis protein [Firmicutes bacterium]|nr:molybdopterin biosynthesis protein [Bacillota bacterium]